MDTHPGISVVVPTLGRPAHVAALLLSLAGAAKRYSGPSEVLIVDDSEGSDEAAIRELCARHGAHYFRGTASVRQKRNLGIEQAAHGIVLFIDSDCEADPDLFGRHAEVYAEADAAIAGVVGSTEFVGRDSWTWQVVRRTQFLNAFSFATRMEYAPWATCSNTSYRREVLQCIGGFDASFPFRLGGDDVDLGIRVHLAGYRLKCNPLARVRHARETWESLVAVGSRAFRWGRMDVHLYHRKHRDRVVPGMPKLSQVFLLLLTAAAVRSVTQASLLPLLFPLGWAAATLLLQAIFTVAASRESYRLLPQELAADLLSLAFEAGTIVEAALRRQLSVFWKTVRRGPVLPGFEHHEWVSQAWSMWLALAALLGLLGPP